MILASYFICHLRKSHVLFGVQHNLLAYSSFKHINEASDHQVYGEYLLIGSEILVFSCEDDVLVLFSSELSLLEAGFDSFRLIHLSLV